MQDILAQFDLGDDIKIFEIENDPEMNKIQDHMAKQTGARSVSKSYARLFTYIDDYYVLYGNNTYVICFFFFPFFIQVPRVFIGGKFVGGGDEVTKLKSSGKLAQLISSARSG